MRFASYATIALSFIGAAVALPAVKRTSVDDIETAMSTLASKISALDAALVAYPAADHLLTPSELYNQILAAGSAADTATAAAQPITVLSDDDSKAIFVRVQNAIPKLDDLVQQLIAKKSGFTGLPASGGIEALILKGLQSFTNSITTLGNSLVAIAPPDKQSNAETLVQRITRALATVIVAYSS
ncbi:hypothetical protein BDN72DRAFT_959544 [Pluteus cervinus]|uniref:Uncharacterized protein n=1 Tax=Pluteus cervinus TaxID=181527 RepID=A0ACD3AUM4_9AGAR|nr:hypothetical protein BDN72DRAFT_959544 [Pluteus cervinus]